MVRELKKLRSRAAEVGLDVSQISAPESQSPTQNQPGEQGDYTIFGERGQLLP